MTLSPQTKLNQQIFLLREELSRAVDIYGSLNHPNVVAISQELDKVIVEQMREVSHA